MWKLQLSHQTTLGLNVLSLTILYSEKICKVILKILFAISIETANHILHIMRIMQIILRAIPSKRFSLLAITASRIWSSRTAHPLFTLGFQQTLNIIHNHN
ncbi:hypothetical protein, partial [Vibrio parahaemolyticus]